MFFLKTKRPLTIRQKLLISSVLSIFLVMFLSTMLNLKTSTDMHRQYTEINLRNMAFSLSKNKMTISALKNDQPNDELNNLIDSIISEDNGIDIVTIANMNGVRIYHIDKSLIGMYFVGGDEQDVYKGKSYSSMAVGTRGLQFRYFQPVYDSDGKKQIGFVMVSTLMSNFSTLQHNIIISSVKLGLLVMMAGITISIILGIKIKDSLLGYEPEQIAALVIQREEIFDSLDEGLMAIDSSGKIVLTNKTARSLLNIGRSDIIGEYINDLAPNLQLSQTLKTGTSTHGLNISLGSVDIVLDTIPIIRSGKTLGAIAVLRNRTELRKMAEQLTGVNHFIEALQANSHEYMNRLHVILGLIQIQAYDDAIKYITDISIEQETISKTIIGRIENRMLAALILGKISRAKEYNIELNLVPSSYVPVHSKFLSSYALVTIVGNLIENAIDAINALEDKSAPREITLSIVENQDNLLITVDDTGIGMSEKVINKLLQGRYSTKGINHGTGMTLIKQIVNDCGGHISIESEENLGTCISIIIKEKRDHKKEVT